jgi:hypothetical protein
LLIRRHGCVWAVARQHVLGVRALADEVEVASASGPLRADEVLRYARDLRPIPAGPVTRSVLAPGCTALAASPHGPLIVIDGSAPPRALRPDADHHASLESPTDGTTT